MKKFKTIAVYTACSAILAFVIAAGSVGCSTNSETTAYNTIGSIEATGQTAYDSYCTLVIKGTIPTNSIPTVSAAYNQLQADLILAATLSSQGTNGLATTNLTADLAALTSVIATIPNQ
jgi:hypothetical protein